MTKNLKTTVTQKPKKYKRKSKCQPVYTHACFFPNILQNFDTALLLSYVKNRANVFQNKMPICDNIHAIPSQCMSKFYC
jgi:hypothetical protein